MEVRCEGLSAFGCTCRYERKVSPWVGVGRTSEGKLDSSALRARERARDLQLILVL